MFASQIELSYIEDISRSVPKSNSSVANNNLGSAYVKMNDIKKSLNHLKRAIDLDPNFSDPYTSLGTIYSQIGNFELSKKFLDRAITFHLQFK